MILKFAPLQASGISCLLIYFWLPWASATAGLSPLVVQSRLLAAAVRPLPAGLCSGGQGLSCFATRGIFPDWGLEPVALTLAGVLLTTEPPGKPCIWDF